MESSWYHGAILITLLLAFLGLWAWAWSRKRKPTFDEASKLPLEEDEDVPPPAEDRNGN